MVEVYKTNVNDLAVAHNLKTLLLLDFPGYKINFDLDDCDRILRVESHAIDLMHFERQLKFLNCEFERLI